jgi:hypothetical protein|tara:strand:+ start:1368 stop:1769 length:402 start_codon:yes stop_codon:yes gene_type:complete
MNKFKASIKQTFFSLHKVPFRIKQKQLDRTSVNQKLFFDFLQNMQRIEIRREKLLDIGLDVTAYEDMFFHVIESLLNLTFNKKQLELLHTYLYELAPNPDWDGTIKLKINEKEERIVNLKTPKDVWEVLQKMG